MLQLTCFVGVRVQQDPAGFLQVPLATLQKLFAFGSGAQAEPEQLLHLQPAAEEQVRLLYLFINVTGWFYVKSHGSDGGQEKC